MIGSASTRADVDVDSDSDLDWGPRSNSDSDSGVKHPSYINANAHSPINAAFSDLQDSQRADSKAYALVATIEHTYCDRRLLIAESFTNAITDMGCGCVSESDDAVDVDFTSFRIRPFRILLLISSEVHNNFPMPGRYPVPP